MREVTQIGLDGASNPMLRYTDEMHLPDHRRSIVKRDTHALVIYAAGIGGSRLVALDTFDSFDKALVAYDKAVELYDADESAARMALAVRSTDDPRVVFGVNAEAYFERADLARIRGAVREYVRRERGATATTMLRSASDGDTFDGIVNRIMESLNKRGVETKRHEAEAALKSRVIIGRCRKAPWMGGGCDRAFFFAKGTGVRLADVRCMHCGCKLNQTSLAYRPDFKFIADPASTFFDSTLTQLPGETGAQRDARLERFMKEVEA